jgi:hypothetical protein
MKPMQFFVWGNEGGPPVESLLPNSWYILERCMLYGGLSRHYVEGCCGAGESFNIVKCLSRPFKFSQHRVASLNTESV